MNDGISLNEILEYSQKYICMEDALDEFGDDLFIDEEDKYVEKFLSNEEEHGDIESLDEILFDSHVLLSDFRSDVLIDKRKNNEIQVKMVKKLE